MNKVKQYQKYIYVFLIVLFFTIYLGYSLISGEVVKPNNPYEKKDEQVSKVSLRAGLGEIIERPDKEMIENKEEPVETESELEEFTERESSEPVEPEGSEEAEPKPEKTEDPESEPEETEDPESEPEEIEEPKPKKTEDPESEPGETEDPEPKPEESEDPESEPEEIEEPEPKPEKTEEPESEPGETEDPEPKPEESENPEPKPEESEDPESEPEETEDPESEPEEIEDPEPKPEESEDPESEPEETEDPEAEPMPEPGDNFVGTVSISIEAVTLGLGTFASNSNIGIIEGDNGVDLLNRFFEENGIAYQHRGDRDASFYLVSINIPGINQGVNIPEEGLANLEEEQIDVDFEVDDVNSLGEFDYTFESGWMYYVNGSYMNYGFSDYVVEEGDDIRIRFTLRDGRDMGS